MKYTKEQVEQALGYLRAEYCKPGTRIYTILRHVSSSGMSRSIDCLVIDTDGKPYMITHHVARVLGYPIDRKNGGVKVSGCGMDMGYAIVNDLSYKLHGMQDKGVKAIKARKLGMSFSATRTQYRAGYSLEHSWL